MVFFCVKTTWVIMAFFSQEVMKPYPQNNKEIKQHFSTWKWKSHSNFSKTNELYEVFYSWL